MRSSQHWAPKRSPCIENTCRVHPQSMQPHAVGQRSMQHSAPGTCTGNTASMICVNGFCGVVHHFLCVWISVGMAFKVLKQVDEVGNPQNPNKSAPRSTQILRSACVLIPMTAGEACSHTRCQFLRFLQSGVCPSRSWTCRKRRYNDSVSQR